jgi:hypothetical protein
MKKGILCECKRGSIEKTLPPSALTGPRIW